MVEIFQDIRKLYTFTSPCAELKDHIEFFSESDPVPTKLHAGDDVFAVKMFSSWTPTFYINLGSQYLISSSGKWHQIGAGEDILVLRDSVVERLNQPSDNIFTVKFYPGGLRAVLGIDQTKCTDSVISLQQVLPAVLLAKLKQPIGYAQRVNLMEEYLLNKLQINSYDDHYLQLVGQAIGEYAANSMQLSTDKVAQKVFLTSKTINRYFHRVIGVSPKQYFSVLRARTSLTAYIGNRVVFSPEKYGYYDSSHFSKEILKFTGTRLRSI